MPRRQEQSHCNCKKICAISIYIQRLGALVSWSLLLTACLSVSGCLQEFSEVMDTQVLMRFPPDFTFVQPI